jgi:mannose-6-phosphate isomerase-like protein (cupin superfamily)
MSSYAVKRIDEMEGIAGGAFKRARAELGISSFGMQVFDMPPNATFYPEHDHAPDGQEEVYVVLRGSGEIGIDGERVAIDRDVMVGIPAGVKRKVFPGDEGVRLLIIGGVPGKAYESTPITELGAPDPYA